MKKVILIELIFLSFSLTTNAQQANIDLFQNETAATEKPASKINLNHSHFLSVKNVLQFTTYPEPAHNKAYYLNKGRNNSIASLCLAGGGFVIAGIGALTFPKNYDLILDNESEKENQADASTALIIAGSAVMLSSIPFTVLASVYKCKANLMVTSQKTGFGVPANVSKDITGITMTIPIGK